MKGTILLLLVVFLNGCATALEREGRCLASLTPEYLQAQDELLRLDSSWRASARREIQLEAQGGPLTAGPDPKGVVTQAGTGTALDLSTDRSTAHAAYERLAEAKARHQSTLDWYQKVYDRVRLRIEEEEILSDTRLILFTGPGIVFYPIVRWNLRSVLWDGADPDADSDPITHYCEDRLAAGPRQVEAKVGAPTQAP